MQKGWHLVGKELEYVAKWYAIERNKERKLAAL